MDLLEHRGLREAGLMAASEVTAEKDARWAMKNAEEERDREWDEWNRLLGEAEQAQRRAIAAMNRWSAARAKLKALGVTLDP